MTYLVSVGRQDDSDALIVSVYNTELSAHLRTAVKLKAHDIPYSEAIGKSITWAVTTLEKEANFQIKIRDNGP